MTNNKNINLDEIVLPDNYKPSEQEEYMNPYVKGHYSAKGLETLGVLAGKRFAEYRNGGR